MIPYGLYVLTAMTADGQYTAATVNWVTQASFTPPLLAIAIKADSNSHVVVKQAGFFNLNILGKGQGAIAFTFFKSASLSDGKLSGEPFHLGLNGAPVLDHAPAYIELKLVTTIEGKGDHSVFLAEVTNVGVMSQPTGRPDDATLMLKDLGEKIYYGG
ncbi:MAG TPA: flavin reductase family protein [Anaerolineae bacterium]